MAAAILRAREVVFGVSALSNGMAQPFLAFPCLMYGVRLACLTVSLCLRIVVIFSVHCNGNHCDIIRRHGKHWPSPNTAPPPVTVGWASEGLCLLQ